MISTTIEQSKHLVELGLDEKTADMHYRWCLCKYNGSSFYEDWLHEVGEVFDECPDALIPSWSLTAMFKQMPEGCDIRKHYGYDINDLRYVAGIWEYSEYEGFSEYPKYTTKFYDNPIDAAYDLLCWLIENDYIKTKKQ